MSRREELRRYVLGTLTEPAREELEAQLLADEALSAEYEDVEDEIVEAYLRGTLDAGDRARVEDVLRRNPVFERRVALARALHDHHAGAGDARPRPITWGSLTAAAALLLCALVLWRALDMRPPSDVAGGDHRAEPRPTAAPPMGTSPSTPMPSSRRWVSLSLAPGQTMGGANDAVVRTASVDEVRLELMLDEPVRERYFAELRDAGGVALWQREAVPADRAEGVLHLGVPASVLQAGRYDVRVAAQSRSAAESSAFYHFTVRAD